jgi:hypothetical protein
VGQATPHRVVLALGIEGSLLLAQLAPPSVVRSATSATERPPEGEVWPTASHIDVEGHASATSPRPGAKFWLAQFEPASVLRSRTKLREPAAMASHVDIEGQATE